MSSTINKFIIYLRLLRVHQWVKNIFVFGPLLFSVNFLNLELVIDAFFATLLFCLGSSLIYIINDLNDVAQDKKHKLKKNRPIASGNISFFESYLIIVFLSFILLISFIFSKNVMMIILSYIILNVFYTLNFKYIPVLDIFCIAISFLLRVFAGAIAINVSVSSWMLITVFSLALFLATLKRKSELENYKTQRIRYVLNLYNENLLNNYAQISAITTILFYSLFVISEVQQLSFTVPIVLFGLFRYWFLIEIKNLGENPSEVISSDIIFLMTIVIWLLMCTFFIYFG